MVLLFILLGLIILIGLAFIIISSVLPYKITDAEKKVYCNHSEMIKGSVRGNTGRTESFVVLEIRRKRNNLPGMKI